jgi:hypothetical protein
VFAMVRSYDIRTKTERLVSPYGLRPWRHDVRETGPAHFIRSRTLV